MNVYAFHRPHLVVSQGCFQSHILLRTCPRVHILRPTLAIWVTVWLCWPLWFHKADITLLPGFTANGASPWPSHHTQVLRHNYPYQLFLANSSSGLSIHPSLSGCLIVFNDFFEKLSIYLENWQKGRPPPIAKVRVFSLCSFIMSFGLPRWLSGKEDAWKSETQETGVWSQIGKIPWWAVVHGVPKSWTQLRTHAHYIMSSVYNLFASLTFEANLEESD